MSTKSVTTPRISLIHLQEISNALLCSFPKYDPIYLMDDLFEQVFNLYSEKKHWDNEGVSSLDLTHNFIESEQLVSSAEKRSMADIHNHIKTLSETVARRTKENLNLDCDPNQTIELAVTLLKIVISENEENSYGWAAFHLFPKLNNSIEYKEEIASMICY